MKWHQVGAKRRWRSGEWVIEHVGYAEWDIFHRGKLVGKRGNPVDARKAAEEVEAGIISPSPTLH